METEQEKRKKETSEERITGISSWTPKATHLQTEPGTHIRADVTH